MSLKSDLYNQLKNSGRPLTTSYPNYTVAQLQAELGLTAGAAAPSPAAEWDEDLPDLLLPEMGDTRPGPTDGQSYVPVQPQADPEEMPGQRLNTQTSDEVIRVDEKGRQWYQEEVRKPAYPKPRGRRVLKYVETGVEVKTVQNGEYVETFEVAGVAPGRPAEVKITLPSYQVGIYKDPRFPFKIHTYNGRDGFDLADVHAFYGGAELVPEDCKRVYIENDLCYDVRSVIRTIQSEHRQLQLIGRAK